MVLVVDQELVELVDMEDLVAMDGITCVSTIIISRKRPSNGCYFASSPFSVTSESTSQSAKA
jgi:hypothetical protein